MKYFDRYECMNVCFFVFVYFAIFFLGCLSFLSGSCAKIYRRLMITFLIPKKNLLTTTDRSKNYANVSDSDDSETEEIDPDKLPALEVQPGEHKLQYNYCLWYHKGSMTKFKSPNVSPNAKRFHKNRKNFFNFLFPPPSSFQKKRIIANLYTASVAVQP